MPVQIGIWVTNPDIKERRSLVFPETRRMNIQPCLLCYVSSSVKLLSSNVLEDGFDFDIAAYRTQEFSFQISQLIMLLDDKSALEGPREAHELLGSE